MINDRKPPYLPPLSSFMEIFLLKRSCYQKRSLARADVLLNKNFQVFV